MSAVPLHPEPVANDPATVRWVVPAGLLSVVGVPAALPPALADLARDGVVESVTVESSAVLVTLTPGHTWRAVGTRVRAALSADLEDPSAWSAAAPTTDDDVLRAAAHEVLDGDVGAFVASHGGALRVVDVTDGVITVDLAGACSHCPAADVTLTDRFADAVRARAPQLRTVRTAERSVERGPLRRLLPLIP
ncbi:NifU family protein [Williamsia serinedens]|uniref:Fe/S biogenesis protein NfuA n=1 Tax=Williamsia serinedens TaxID=391736 RepID=A0ABT1GXV5_9NOCA|nr:NifU family protein [Williamsia serinedens]MCP2159579.1 Fe/S biogenesis protein NfuA [Williamsia serinedens]